MRDFEKAADIIAGAITAMLLAAFIVTSIVVMRKLLSSTDSFIYDLFQNTFILLIVIGWQFLEKRKKKRDDKV